MYRLRWRPTGRVWTWIKQDAAAPVPWRGWLMPSDDSQGHYMTVKLIDAIHRGVILLLTGLPPFAVMKCWSDECFHTFSNPGLFLGWTVIFNHAMSHELWATKSQRKHTVKAMKTTTDWNWIERHRSDTSRSGTENDFHYRLLDFLGYQLIIWSIKGKLPKSQFTRPHGGNLHLFRKPKHIQFKVI